VGTSVNYLDMSLMKHYFQLRKPDSPALDMARFAREGRQPDNSFYRRLGDMIASVPAKVLQARRAGVRHGYRLRGQFARHR
jgi:hypothetical protein